MEPVIDIYLLNDIQSFKGFAMHLISNQPQSRGLKVVIDDILLKIIQNLPYNELYEL